MSLDPCKPLNARQRAIRDAVHHLHRETGMLPSRRMVARHLGRRDGGYLSRVMHKLKTRGELPRG